MLLANLRQEVLETANALRTFGLVWMAGGTVCARDPESGYVVVTPSGLDYDQLNPGDMIVTDIDMNVIDGAYRPSVALNLWTEILRARPEMHAIVHTHSTHATAFSVTGQALPMVTETMADWFGGSVGVAPYMHVEDPTFATKPVEVLGDGFAVLLGRHGPITIGETLHDALERAVTLEEGAKIYYVARVIGEPQLFTEEEARSSYEYYSQRYGQPKIEEGSGI
jgi:L-ribulose-5-phosphate 4-epimerase